MRGRRATRLAAALVAGVAALTVGAGSAGAGIASQRAVAASAPSTPATIDRLPDPLADGPYAVTATEYDYGDTAFTPPGFPGPVEVLASVHYPTDLSGGPRPLVMLMHGRHATCYKGPLAVSGWPCRSGFSPIPSYQGYDYLAENLASWGYIVVSVSANGINAKDAGVADYGMTARAQLMQLHLDTWQTFSTTGAAPFGDLFVGKVDMQDVGEMGHSRGGEGVVRNYQLNAELGAPYGIQAVFALAPVDFGREFITDVPFSVALPYCDGDVSDLQGVHFYDDSRYVSANDPAPKYVQEVLGANHNFFNTVWTPGEFPAGTFDDSTCTETSLTPEHERNAGEAYMAAFFRLHLGGDTQFEPYFNGSESRPASIEPAVVHTSYQAGADRRLDLNRYLDEESLSTNDLGGPVDQGRLTPFDLCGGSPPQPAECLSVPEIQQPHTVGDEPGLSQLRYGWSDNSGHLTNTLPAGFRNVAAFETVTFRVARNFDDARNGQKSVPNFSVRLSDGSGHRQSAKVGAWSDALFNQPGLRFGLPKLVLSTVRIPLSAYRRIDLNDVREVTFRNDGRQRGAVLVTDLAFTDRS